MSFTHVGHTGHSQSPHSSHTRFPHPRSALRKALEDPEGDFAWSGTDHNPKTTSQDWGKITTTSPALSSSPEELLNLIWKQLEGSSLQETKKKKKAQSVPGRVRQLERGGQGTGRKLVRKSPGQKRFHRTGGPAGLPPGQGGGGNPGGCGGSSLWGSVVFPGCPHLDLPSPESQLVTTLGQRKPEKLPSALMRLSVCQRLQPRQQVLSHSCHSVPRFHTANSAGGPSKPAPHRETETDSHRGLGAAGLAWESRRARRVGGVKSKVSLQPNYGCILQSRK